jgi:hypothetical protein
MYNATMARPLKDYSELIGQPYALLEIVGFSHKRLSTGKSQVYLKCQCQCGTHIERKIQHVLDGDVTSCGCITASFKHGLGKDWVYLRCRAIIRRCSNPKDAAFKNYGARGILVYPAWIEDIVSFVNYVKALPKINRRLDIDRIDNEQGYIPGNLRFTTRLINNRNKRKRTVENT